MFNHVHVIKIEMIRIEDLNSLQVTSPTTCRMKSSLFFTDLEIQDLVGVTVEDSYENAQRKYNTTVTFKTPCRKLLALSRMAFRLTDVNGNQYLVGTNSRPYAIIKELQTFPDKVPDSSLKQFTITWKSMHPMLLIEG